MRISLFFLFSYLLLFRVNAQTQTVGNGSQTTPINFPVGGCNYSWTNNNPSIGLPASGTGDISAFKAVNNGTVPATATITATPVSSGFAYITNGSSNDVSVINTSNHSLVTTIPVGNFPFGEALSPDGNTLYVVNTNQGPTDLYPKKGSVSVINTQTNTVVTTIPVGATPLEIAISPDGTRAYVTNANDGSYSIINTATNTVTATLPFDSPLGVTISPDGKKLYITSDHGSALLVYIINAATNEIIATVPTNSYSPGLVTNLNGSVLYITDHDNNTVEVVNTVTDNIITSIPVGVAPYGISISPDGDHVYVTNSGSRTVSVINTSTNKSIATIPINGYPEGISASPDGKEIYVANENPDGITVINTATYTITSTINGGTSPIALGNFISKGQDCNSSPLTFAITVNPSGVVKPNITFTSATGFAASCEGLPSSKGYQEKFTVAGDNLTDNVTITAPLPFEVSLNPDNGFSNSLTLAPSEGTLATTNVYVRLSATALPGKQMGNVTLSSAGADNQQVAIQGEVNVMPVANQVGPQVIFNGEAIAAIPFNGNADEYIWTNDKPGIGLAAQGSGEIFSFKGINSGTDDIVAHITVTPRTNGTSGLNPTPGCQGDPMTFTITIKPDDSPDITITQNPSSLTTVYGTPSVSTYFIVLGTNLTADLLITPPVGFEVSVDGITFNRTVTLTASNHIAGGKVYIRLAATTPYGTYSGNIILNSGSTTTNEAMPASNVTRAPLTITADNKSKFYQQPNPPLTATYKGLVNGETAAQLTAQPVITTDATISSPVGKYDIDIDGAESPNYDITQLPGVLTIYPPKIIVPNTFTPNNDGINDTWEIIALANYPQCTVSVYTRYGEMVYESRGYPAPWNGTYKGSLVPDGTYYYIIYPQPNQKPLSGWVTVIR